MFFIIIAFAVIAAVIIFLLLLKIDLLIEARGKKTKLKIRALRIIIIQRKYELRREYGDIFTLYCVDKPKPKRILSLLDIIKTIKDPNRPKSNERARGQLFTFINVKAKYSLNFQVKLGLEDAFSTAMLCGYVQVVSGSLICLINNNRHIIKLEVIPVFAKRSFSLSADCIITLSLANIIIGYMIYKIKKGGD